MNKNTAKYSDNELCKMLRKEHNQSEAAFTELYHRYSQMVHSYCTKVLNNQMLAEDIFQETFIKFFQSINPEHDNPNIPGFLLKIARNLCLNDKRDTKVVTVTIEDDNYIGGAEINYEKKELLELITRSLDLLEFDYREAFVLKEYDGLTYEEIADICNITLNNAKSRVHRAKIKIREILAPYLNDLYKN